MLKQKLGPLPVWAWLGLVTVILLGWWLYEQHKGAASSAGSTADQMAADTAPEIVIQTGGDTTATQTATPPGPPEKGTPIKATPQPKPPVKKPDPDAKADAEQRQDNKQKRKGSPIRRKSPEPKPVAGGRPLGGGGSAPPKKATPVRKKPAAARHLATSHPAED